MRSNDTIVCISLLFLLTKTNNAKDAVELIIQFRSIERWHFFVSIRHSDDRKANILLRFFHRVWSEQIIRHIAFSSSSSILTFFFDLSCVEFLPDAHNKTPEIETRTKKSNWKTKIVHCFSLSSFLVCLFRQFECPNITPSSNNRDTTFPRKKKQFQSFSLK